MLERFTHWYNLPGKNRGICEHSETAYEAGWNAATRFHSKHIRNFFDLFLAKIL